MKRFALKLEQINQKPYGNYQRLSGDIRFPFGTLKFEHIQSDPYAPPSRMLFELPHTEANFPSEWTDNADARVALADFLVRRLSNALHDLEPVESTGNTGQFRLNEPGPEILARAAVIYTSTSWLVRFGVGLPAEGRAIRGDEARTMLLEQLPWALQSSLCLQDGWKEEAENFIKHYLRQLDLAKKCEAMGLIAFIPKGAILPRERSGSSKPLAISKAVAFDSPLSLAVSIKLSDGTCIEGMGLKGGVHLIVGGGFHGKSTLLAALQLGMYRYIQGDGREFVYVAESAQKVRGSSGRVVGGTDISAWVGVLPSGQDGKNFSTENASGSTSQAASIVEAIQCGCKVLLMDEDTCATNLMVRDARMSELLKDFSEPITPYIRRVRMLWEKLGVSTILITGGVGDYLEVCDTVLAMENYKPVDLSTRVHELYSPKSQVSDPSIPISLKYRPKYKVEKVIPAKEKSRIRGAGKILVGEMEIDASDLEQVVCDGQWHYMAALAHHILAQKKDWSIAELKKLLQSLPNFTPVLAGETRSEWVSVSLGQLWQVLSRTSAGRWV